MATLPTRYKVTLWLHLVFVVAASLAFGMARVVINGFYKVLSLLGFRFLLDWSFRHTAPLQKTFRLHLGETKRSQESYLFGNTPELIRGLGCEVEEHCVFTKDGYILGVHRMMLPPLGEYRHEDWKHVVVDSSEEERLHKTLQEATFPAGHTLASQRQRRSTPRSGHRPQSPRSTLSSRSGGGTGAGFGTGGGTNDENPDSNGAAGSVSEETTRKPRPPVLLQHGLMQNSESFVCSGENSLALFLLEAGYDVWLGNNRGNKYSCNHVKLDPRHAAFWDFCIDDLARDDIPATIDHILEVTGFSSLGYVGFSQGSAQLFACLSSQPKVQRKVNSFVALSAAYSIAGLSPSPLASLVETNVNFIYLMFGQKKMLATALTWQRMLSPKQFARVIEKSVYYLFGWHMRNLDDNRKLQMYQHIYSYSSVKNVVHWFQILREKRLQMYMDPSQRTGASPQPYDISLIETPMALFLGGWDGLLDLPSLLTHAPLGSYVFFEPNYEHMDFIWAEDAVKPGRSFENILAFLKQHENMSQHHTDHRAMLARFGRPTPQTLFSRMLPKGSLGTSSEGYFDSGLERDDMLESEDPLGGYLEFRPRDLEHVVESRSTHEEKDRSRRRWKWLLLTLARESEECMALTYPTTISSSHLDTQLVRSVYRRFQGIPDISTCPDKAEQLLENRYTGSSSPEEGEEEAMEDLRQITPNLGTPFS